MKAGLSVFVSLLKLRKLGFLYSIVCIVLHGYLGRNIKMTHLSVLAFFFDLLPRL